MQKVRWQNQSCGNQVEPGVIPLSTVMGDTTEEDIGQVIHTALDCGINLIDTSRMVSGKRDIPTVCQLFSARMNC